MEQSVVGAPGRTREWRLPAAVSSVPVLRRWLRTFLDEGGIPDDDLGDLLLAACEAATNAVEHAQQPTEPFVEICAEIRHGRVTIVVRDHGRWRAPRHDPTRGRGLAMMDVLADTELVSHPSGTTVTLRSRRPGERPVGRG